jgi:N-methylhydantoinase B
MDPITLDICWSRLVGVVNEQAAALMRTSFTSTGTIASRRTRR